jgi:hypothetical protein
MIPKSGNRFPAFAKPASAGEARSEKIMRKQNVRELQWFKLADHALRRRPPLAALLLLQISILME